MNVKVVVAAAVFAASFVGFPAFGEQSTKPQPAYRTRAWPDAGDWRVLMLQSGSSGSRACLFMTGYVTNFPNNSMWGFRIEGGKTTFIVNTSSEEEASASEIQIFINKSLLGRFPVTSHQLVRMNESPAMPQLSAKVELNDADTQKRFLGLLHNSQTLGFLIKNTMLEAQISKDAVVNLEQCMLIA